MDPITLPEDLSTLSDEDLAALAESITARGAELGDDENLDEQGLSELEALAAALDAVDAETNSRQAAATDRSERRQAAAARFASEESDEDDDEDTDATEGETADADAEATPVPVPAAAAPVAAANAPTIAAPVTTTPSNAGQQLAARRPKANKAREVTEEREFMTATAHAPMVNEGFKFATPMAVAEAIANKRNRFGMIPSGVRQEYVSIAQASKTIEHEIGNDAMENFSVLRGVQADMKSLVASGGVCAPLSPSYDFFRLAEPQSPVQEGVPTVQAPRGGIRYIVPPNTTTEANAAIDFSAIDRDYDDEADGPKACTRVVCPETADAMVTAVSQCIYFDNLNHRVFPEQVAAFMEDVAVAFESKKEVFFLDYINSQSTQVSGTFEYGLNRTLLFHWTTAAVAYRKRHGMKRGAALTVMAPDWALDAIKLDLAMQEHNESFFSISDSEAEAALANRGLSMIWYNDNPTGVTPNQKWSAPQTTGALNLWPSKVKAFIYAPGTFVRLDGGTLDVGLVRDSVLNRTNDLQLFMEEWIGGAKLGFESVSLLSTACINGAAPGPVTARTCA